MKRSKFITCLVLSFCLGALLFGGAQAIAAAVDATPTTAKVTVDGKEVAVDAYNIGGNNYFKLRDFTAAIDIGVWFDQAVNTIHIETDKAYDASYNGPNTPTTPPAGTSSAANQTTVYVSEASSTIHAVSDCGGMKNSNTMTLEAARKTTDKYCDTCAQALKSIE